MNIELATKNPNALYILWILEDAGYEARICGGAVRDMCRGSIPKDWDIATTALPEQVIEVMTANEIDVIPTGLKHGTVTAMKDSEPFEITTLRVDTKTDGRHAEVEYTDDWVEDSNRRDFTINAMYMDSTGKIYDYHNGREDVRIRVVKFVGDPEDRIHEDHLRILRYARFSNIYGVQDRVGTDKIIKKNITGIKKLSGERIWDEIKKIVYSKSPNTGINILKDLGVLDMLGFQDLGVCKMGQYNSKYPNCAVTYIASYCCSKRSLCIFKKILINRFHASSIDIKKIQFIIDHYDVIRNRREWFRLSAFHDEELVHTWFACGAHLIDVDREIVIPDFPVSGNDLIARGIKSGPAMGKIIHDLKIIWADHEFNIDKEELLAHIDI